MRHNTDDIIEVQTTHPLLSPFVNSIPLHLLTHHLMVFKAEMWTTCGTL
jgi:glucosamine 6-phosphate synthetase-like amidotransferase/phosphosugar isomerase protein